MQRAHDIIDRGRIGFGSGSFIDNFIVWLVFTGTCTYALYRVHFSPRPADEDKPLLFYTVVFFILLPVCICFLFLSIKKLKAWFYKNDTAIEKKSLAIEQLASRNGWRLIRAEQYSYSDGSWFGSDVTFAFDETGIYINCYPHHLTLGAVGTSKSDADKIYEELKVRLRS